MVRTLLTVILFALLSASAYAAESYLCVADMATGFKFDKNRKEWKTTAFKAGNKYVLTKSKHEGYAWEVKKVGIRITQSWCKKDFDKYGFLLCDGFFAFKFNKNNLRFLNVHSIGYVDENLVDPEGNLPKVEGITPLMEIGKCSLL